MELDCTIIVPNNHITKNKNIEWFAHAWKSAYWAMIHIHVFIKSSPKNIRHNQITIFNTFFILSDFNIKYKSTEIHKAGNAIVIKSNHNHNVSKITQTTELPIFAHKITFTACENSIIHAETNDSKIKSTAELHWKSNVAKNQIHNDLKILFVAFLIAFLIPPDTTFLLDSSKNIIQSMNKPNHPKNCAIFPNVIFSSKNINHLP